MGWAAPGGVAHMVRRGYPGSYPPRHPKIERLRTMPGLASFSSIKPNMPYIFDNAISWECVLTYTMYIINTQITYTIVVIWFVRWIFVDVSMQ